MYVRNYTQGRTPREINGAPTRDYVPFSRPEPILIPDHYHGELLRSAAAEQPTDPGDGKPEKMPEQEESGECREQTEQQFPAHGGNPQPFREGKEDILLLCAVGMLLFAGQGGHTGWTEEDLALLLILLLLIT